MSNRESCRDEWFHLMKEAAAQTHSFAARQLGGAGGGRGPGTASDRLSEVGSRVAAGGAVGGGQGLPIALACWGGMPQAQRVCWQACRQTAGRLQGLLYKLVRDPGSC